MKNISAKLVPLLKHGYCAPQIARIARELHEPSTTIHYNIKKLEEEGALKLCKGVFNYKKIEEGHCVYLLVNLIQDHYGEPEKVARDIAKNPEVESVDIITGEFELIIKLRTKDIDEYYNFVKVAVKKYGFAKVVSLTSLKQMKTEFVLL
jgi:DNA-binding Lrp family transcriptional regulator